MNPIDNIYESSNGHYDDDGIGAKRRRHPRDDCSDLKSEAPEFDGELNLENNLGRVPAIKRIFKLKSTILNMKGHACLR